MSLASNIQAAFTRVATEFKAIRTLIGGSGTATISGLNTTDKSSLVGAINEVKASVASAAGINDSTTGTTTTWSSQKISDQIATKPSIDDASAPSGTAVYSSQKTANLVSAKPSINDGATQTTSVWSGQKVSDSIAAAISALVNGAPTALDTLKEIADQLAADESAATALATAVNNRVRFDAAQSLTNPQKAQAQQNINAADATAVGDTTTDFAAGFVAALA